MAMAAEGWERTQLLVLQPTPFCNLDCSYCYLPNREARSRMSLETVRRAAEFVCEIGYDAPLRVSWHVGEPMVVPAAWYQEAHEVLSNALGRDRIEINFQTNGTLISDGWVRLFESDPRIRVCVSVDGPPELHDPRRRDRGGRGSHARAMVGIRRLQAAGISFSCIAVITERTLEAANAFYEFFEALRPRSLGLSPEEDDGVHTGSSMAGADARQGYRNFLQALLERWLPSRPFEIREFARMDALIAHGGVVAGQGPPRQQSVAGPVITVGWDGAVHTFSPELLGMPVAGIGTSLGSVHTDSWRTIAAKPAFRELARQIDSGVGECRRTCPYYAFCGGGVPSNKWFEKGSFEVSETDYCQLVVQSTFDEYLSALERRSPGMTEVS